MDKNVFTKKAQASSPGNNAIMELDLFYPTVNSNIYNDIFLFTITPILLHLIVHIDQ